MENISLKDKCKGYQKMFDYKLDTDKWIIAHLDGKNFSKMVKNRFNKPFDIDFIRVMNETAKYLCDVQGVKFAYVQSDEISLLIKKDNPEGDVFFGGRMSKLQSILASMATAKFNQLMQSLFFYKMEDKCYDSDNIGKMILNLPLYVFDCKVWTVDNANDAMAWFLFRNIDCIRNSKSQAAQTYISHTELRNKTADEGIEMLKEKHNIVWRDYPEGMKYGRYVIRKNVTFTVLKEEVRKKYSTAENCAKIEHANPEDYIEVTRPKLEIINGFDLTNAENREKLLEICPSFKEN